MTLIKCPVLGFKTAAMGDAQEILVLTPDASIAAYEVPLELAHEILTRGWVLIEDLRPVN